MIMTTHPILFPPLLLATDGSPSARRAQQWLVLIGRSLTSNGQNGSSVTVLTVQPRQSSRSQRLLKKRVVTTPETGIPIHKDAQTTEADLAAGIDTIAEQVRANFPADMQVDMQVRQGRPATEVLSYARTIQAGLIGVGSRGTGGMRELLLGSVSVVIARYAPCSVLIARGTGFDLPEPELAHVLLVVNSPGENRAAIAALHQLIPAGIRRVTLVHTQPPLNADYLFGPFVAPTPSWQLDQSLRAAHREQGEQVLSEAVTALNQPDLEIQTLLQMGEAGPAICQIAQQQQVDLILLGNEPGRRRQSEPAQPFPLGSKEASRSPLQAFRRRNGRGGRQRPILWNSRLSSTEDYTIHHAPCPVLLCRFSR